MFNRFLPFLAALALGSAALAQQLPLLPDDEVSAQIAEIDVGVICAQEIVGFNDAPGTIAGTTRASPSSFPARALFLRLWVSGLV